MVYEVISLSADETQLVKLTITITPNGVAHVTKSLMGRSPTDVIQQFVVGKNLNNISSTELGSDGGLTLTVTEIPLGYALHWVPIDLDQLPIQNGGPSITWLCVASDCDPGDACGLSSMPTNVNIATLVCNNTCSSSCTLKSGKAGGSLINRTGSGVYILAKEVHYLDLPEEKPMRERDFHGGSLTADGSRYIQLSVDYDSLGIAHVTKDTRPPRRNDKVKVYFNTSQNSVVFSTPMDDNYEEINYENRSEKDTIYWIPIAMDSPPVGIPGSKIKVWCEGEKEGFARSVFFWGTNYVDCSESSSELNISINGSEPHTGGGIYLYAKGIVYE